MLRFETAPIPDSERVAVPDMTERPVADLVSLADQVAVVAGGASGIGRAITHRLSEAGAIVVVADQDQAGAGQAAEAVTGRGHRAVAHVVDVGNNSSVRQLADSVVTRFGRLDIWINNAATHSNQAALDLSEESWNTVLRVDLSGAFFGAREAARRMKAAGRGGVIVNISAAAVYRTRPNQSAYTAAKSALNGLTGVLAKEFAPFGVRVLGVAPGMIVTPALRPYLSDELMAANKLLGRTGLPDDVARVVLFCVSGLATFMTGTTLVVDGSPLV